MTKIDGFAKDGPEAAVHSFFSSLERASVLSGEGSLAGSLVLAGVSGGSDSVAMLCLLREASSRFGFSLSVVTVNHMIRSREESAGDARFVADLCAGFAPPVPCSIVNLGEGEVASLARARGKGIEEAARHLRYRHFTDIASSSGARFVCTGHTRDDQLETVLMRFLQGGASLGGIARRRGIFLRPVIDCTRSALAGWLTSRGIGWREDSTNADGRYVRNRIRGKLIPLLSSEFPGWDTGVLSSSERSLADDSFCRSRMASPWSDAAWVTTDRGISCRAADYAALDPALRLRFLRDGLFLLAPAHRVPSGLLERLSRAPEERGWRADGSESEHGRDTSISGSGFVFWKKEDTVFWEPDIVQNTKSRYLVSIASPGMYLLPSGSITVAERDGGIFLDGRIGPFSLPLILRSRSGGDTVRMADGRQKTLKKLMNDWAVSASDRDGIPVVEQDGEIRAVYGAFLGYPDWYIHP